MSIFLLCEKKILSSNEIISTKEINNTKCNLNYTRSHSVIGSYDKW